ncbi:DinI family protein [Salmonella enterica subsp. enterica serovar Typhimurium]
MRIELVISRTKQLPEGAVPALEKELIARLQNQYENCNLTIRRGSQDGLSIVGAADGDKKRIQSILQETWESADDWRAFFSIPQFAYPFDAAADNF